MKVLVFGEILWDIIEGENHLGGAPLNFAAHTVQCGHQSVIISALGQNELGDQALQLVNKMGVDTSLVQRKLDKPTGTVLVSLNNGQPDYDIIKDVAYDYIVSDFIDTSVIATADAFYFGSLIQRSFISQQTLFHILNNYTFSKIFYDVNLRKECYSKTIVERSLEYCHLLKVNDEEVAVLSALLFGQPMVFEAFAQKVMSIYTQIELVMMTAGKEGCQLYHDHKLVTVPGIPVVVKDTVGAGDSYSAAFLSTLMKTKDPKKAAIVANHVGGFVASSAGPIPKYSDAILNLVN